MPTANANTGNGFSKALSYVLQERKKVPDEIRAQVLQQNNVFGNSREIGKQMREVAQEREKVQKPVLHLQINFHPEEKLNLVQAEKAVNGILSEIGINKENYQYIVVQHRDKPHDHYHVIVNRVSFEGDLLNDHRIKDRLQVACDKIEKEQMLRQTSGRTVVYDPTAIKGFRYIKSNQQKKESAQVNKNVAALEARTNLKAIVSKVLAKDDTKTPEHLKDNLEKLGVNVKFSKNKNGITGVSFRVNNIAIKGSAIGHKWGDIIQALKLKSELPNEATLKSEFLEIHIKKQHDIKIWMGQNAEKFQSPVQLTDEAISVHMLQLNPQQDVWKTWKQNPNYKIDYKTLCDFAAIEMQRYKVLQPTMQEQKEMKFATDYNPRVEKAITELKAELEKGNTKIKAKEIMVKHGFIQIDEQYVYSSNGLQAKIHTQYIDRAIKKVIEQEKIFNILNDDYQKLINTKPKKVPLVLGKNKIILENLQLSRAKSDAVEPKFTPRVFGLNVSDFIIYPNFELRNQDHIKRISLKENLNKNKMHEQNRNNGLTR